MTKQKFADDIAEIIEASAPLTLDSDFRACADYWSSLVGFAMMIYLEDQCKAKISVDEFIEAKTLGDLFEKIPNREEQPS